MSVILKKIDPTCNNVLLIDSAECLGNSLPKLNQNLQILANKVTNVFEDYSGYVNDGNLALFYNNSALMVNTMININKINEVYVNPYTVIQQTSSLYAYKEFSVYFPQIIDLRSYFTSQYVQDDENILVVNWLNQNFPCTSYAVGQIINVFLSFNYTNYFTYVFDGVYAENCAPTDHTQTTFTCSGCGELQSRYALCNHGSGHHHWCNNAYSYCGSATTGDTETFACQGSIVDTFVALGINQQSATVQAAPAGNLQIHYEWNNLEDNFLARIMKLVFQNQIDQYGNPNWTLQPINQ